MLRLAASAITGGQAFPSHLGVTLFRKTAIRLRRLTSLHIAPKENLMRSKVFLCALVVGLALLNFGCDVANSLTATKIRDLLNHPRDYENKEVTIYGTVTNAASLLVVKYFEIQDNTGAIKVITDKLLPSKGEKMRVSGRMSVVEVGTERWVALRESGNTKTPEDGAPDSGGDKKATG